VILYVCTLYSGVLGFINVNILASLPCPLACQDLPFVSKSPLITWLLYNDPTDRSGGFTPMDTSSLG